MITQGGSVYEQLLWSLKLVEVCPRHRCFLTNTCPHCLKPMRPLMAVSRPGTCWRCGQWLGNSANQTHLPAPDAVPTEYQLWLAEAIGELLANAPRIEPEHLRDRAREGLLAYANAFTEGNRTAVADIAGCRPGIIYSWFKGDQVPRIDTLLHTWYQLKLPIACLVDGAYPGFSPETRAESRARSEVSGKPRQNAAPSRFSARWKRRCMRTPRQACTRLRADSDTVLLLACVA
jgi:hypothetical protein